VLNAMYTVSVSSTSVLIINFTCFDKLATSYVNGLSIHKCCVHILCCFGVVMLWVYIGTIPVFFVPLVKIETLEQNPSRRDEIFKNS
jgi:hypothetical protein